MGVRPVSVALGSATSLGFEDAVDRRPIPLWRGAEDERGLRHPVKQQAQMQWPEGLSFAEGQGRFMTLR